MESFISSEHDSVRALHWNQHALEVLDQRRLPGSLEFRRCASAEDVAEAIATMQVRGAPAIGIAAAYGVVLAARKRFAEDPGHWRAAIEADLKLLAESRPTAVNLSWAIAQMRDAMDSTDGNPAGRLLERARQIHAEDVAANRAMGELGAELLAGTEGVLTHCNTGSLATGGYGTALGVIRSAYRRGLRSVYATETRPWLQGARLTVWELARDGIPATLIADSAAASLMRQGKVQWVVVGADRIAANGDTANKIGTYALAALARYHGVRFMVVAPTSTIDWQTECGDRILIEERDRRELLHEHFLGEDRGITAWNPVFDVTPAALVDAIVTEAGVVLHPDTAAMAKGLQSSMAAARSGLRSGWA